MLRVPWILIVNILITLFYPVLSSEFPSFFDNDDLEAMGVKGHKSTYVPVATTGRYVDHPPGYVAAPLSEMYMQKIPPNGLPIHQLPKTLQNRPPIMPIGRGDPRDQDIVQQLADEDSDRPFPPPDGKPYGGDDTYQLNQMPKRLTETNKWDEFRALIAEEGERQNGKVMENWEDDAHRWAQYSRHLLERGAKEKEKQAVRMRPKPRTPMAYSPSLGHEAYWGEDEFPRPTAAPVQRQSVYTYPNTWSPWNDQGQLISWKRRQMNDPYMHQNPNDYNDNLQGPMENNPVMPPIYYKNPNTPTKDSEPNRQVLERLAQMDYPDSLRNGDMSRYLPPYPENKFRSGPEMVPAGEYSPNLLIDLGKTPGKIPGPGSERDYPNGYRPYGSHPQMSSGMGLEGPRGGYRQNFEHVPRPHTGQYPEAKPTPLKEGPMDYPGPEDYMDTYNSLLRTGRMPSESQGGSKPGSEGDYRDGFRPSMAGANMGLPSGQMGVGPLPGGKYPKNFGQRGAHEMPEAKPAALREGGGYPSMDYPGLGMRTDIYPESNKSPLRMGAMPGDTKPFPGPGSEGDFPEGFHPNIAGENMGLPPMPKELGPLPGRVHGRPPRVKQKGPPLEDMEESVLTGGAAGGIPDGPSATGFSPQGMQGPIGTPRRPQAIRFPGVRQEPGESLEDYIGPDAPQSPPGYGRGNPNQLRGGPPRNPRIPTGYELMTIAKKKIAASNRMDELTDDKATGPTTPRPLTKEEMINSLPQFDDFHAPIRWVKFNSPETRDGLARVTDRKTHQNQQYVIEGELYLPIIDESMSRLGWTTEDPFAVTTDPPIIIPPNDSAIKVVVRSMDLNKTDEREWLAYETILGSKKLHDKECDGQSCQARCHKTGCDAVCKGDTCATGCVGVSCNAVCKGPGCFSMCIGDQCTAKCEGLNCESRCWGKSCEADCRSFSCLFTFNGIENRSNTTWDQMYPQYDMKGNPDVYAKQDQRMGPGPGHGPANGPPSLLGDDYYAD